MSTWKSVLTEKGEALLAKMTQGSTLDITHAEVGSGKVDASLLKQQTSVSTVKQRATIEPVGYPAEGMCALPVTITNEGLSAGYSAWQIGVFANDPDEGSVLFFIAQAEDIATGVPSAALMPSYKTQIIFHLEYGDADLVNVDVNPANAVSQAAMENYVNAKVGTAKEDIANHTANKQNPHGVTAAQLGLGTVKADLANHTANKQNPHGVTADQIGAITMKELPNLHVWKKHTSVDSENGYILGENLEFEKGDSGNSSYTYSYSDDISISDDGSIVLENAETVTISYRTYTEAEVLKGKFFKALNIYYYVSPSATVGQRVREGKNLFTINPVQKVIISTKCAGEFIEYVASKESSTYPRRAEHTDGYWYEYQRKIGEVPETPEPAFTYGTRDLTPGVSPLETGKLYIVYE